MSNKQEQLLKLLQKSSGPVTGKQLADELHTSSRTIINYVKRINEEYDEDIIVSSQNGYYIRHDAQITKDEDDLPQNREGRMFYLLELLILSGEDGINAFDLADELYISYSLLKKDITEFNITLKPYKLSVISKNNILRILGSEESKRKAVTALIQKNSNGAILNDDVMKHYFGEKIIDGINHILLQNEQRFGIYINEFSRLNLVLHLAMTVNRIMYGNELDSGGQERIVSDDQIDSFVTAAADDIEKEFHIAFNQTERTQTLALLQSHVHSDAYIHSETGPDTDHAVLNITREILNRVRSVFYLDFTSEAFVIPFGLHIENLLIRLRGNILIDNPIKESFRNSSPFLYDIALFIMDDIKTRFQIDTEVSDNELTFLVIHLALELERQKKDYSAVSCILFFPKYLGMEKNLAGKLRTHFEDQITIVNTVSREEDILKYECDLIISFVSLSIPAGKKYMQISPLLTQNDYERLSEAVTAIYQEKQLERFRTIFPFFFEKKHFAVSREEMDKYTAIHRICEMLKKTGTVDDGFEEQVILREKAISTGFMNFAVPHGVSTAVRRQAVGVMIFPGGILWDSRQTYCVMLMAVNPENLNEFQEMYNALLLILMETDFVSRLRDISSFDAFCDKILSVKLQ